MRDEVFEYLVYDVVQHIHFFGSRIVVKVVNEHVSVTHIHTYTHTNIHTHTLTHAHTSKHEEFNSAQG